MGDKVESENKDNNREVINEFEETRKNRFESLDENQVAFKKKIHGFLDNDDIKIITINGKFGTGKTYLLNKYVTDGERTPNYKKIEVFNFSLWNKSFKDDHIAYIFGDYLSQKKKPKKVESKLPSPSVIFIYLIVLGIGATILSSILTAVFGGGLIKSNNLAINVMAIIVIIVLSLMCFFIIKRHHVIMFFSKIKSLPSKIFNDYFINIITKKNKVEDDDKYLKVYIFEDIDRLEENDFTEIMQIITDLSEKEKNKTKIILSVNIEDLSENKVKIFHKLESSVLYYKGISNEDFVKALFSNQILPKDKELCCAFLDTLEINPGVKININARTLKYIDCFLTSKNAPKSPEGSWQRNPVDILLEFVLDYYYGYKIHIGEKTLFHDAVVGNILDKIFDSSFNKYLYEYTINSREVFREFFKKTKKSYITNNTESAMKFLSNKSLLSTPICFEKYLDIEINKNSEEYMYKKYQSTIKDFCEKLAKDNFSLINDEYKTKSTAKNRAIVKSIYLTALVKFNHNKYKNIEGYSEVIKLAKYHMGKLYYELESSLGKNNWHSEISKCFDDVKYFIEFFKKADYKTDIKGKKHLCFNNFTLVINQPSLQVMSIDHIFQEVEIDSSFKSSRTINFEKVKEKICPKISVEELNRFVNIWMEYKKLFVNNNPDIYYPDMDYADRDYINEFILKFISDFSEIDLKKRIELKDNLFISKCLSNEAYKLNLYIRKNIEGEFCKEILPVIRMQVNLWR